MNHLPSLLSVMSTFGDGGKPLWFTEFGWSVHHTAVGSANWQRGVTPFQAADYLNRTLALVTAKYPEVKKLFWYQDRTDGTDPATSGYGLVFPDGRATEALDAAAALWHPVTTPASSSTSNTTRTDGARGPTSLPAATSASTGIAPARTILTARVMGKPRLSRGWVVVFAGRKVVGRGRMVSGRAAVVLRGVSVGVHQLSVVFSGTDSLRSSRVTIALRVGSHATQGAVLFPARPRV